MKGVIQLSYNKKIWANGDLITKERMNNIEDGIFDAHDKITAINNKVEENTSLREELELTQEAVNEILFNSLGGE